MKPPPLLLVSILALLAAPARAQESAPSAPLGESLQGAAKMDYEAGRSLYAERDFPAALIKFTSAYDASKDARLLWNMASCEEKRHRYTKAVALLRRFVDEGGARLTDRDRADAAQYIKAIEPLTSTARIVVSAPGAEVFVDDELVGTSPLPPIAIDIGVHALRVHKSEYQDAVRRVTIAGGAEVPIDVALVAVVHEGRLSVRAPAKASIALDGRPLGVGAWVGAVPSGGHTLSVTAAGMQPYQSEVLVQDGQSRDVSVTLIPEPTKGLLPTWAWIAGGVVLAGGLGAGGYLLFKPSSHTVTPPTGTIGTVPSGAVVRF